MKYLNNYETRAAYDSDTSRPTDSSVVSSIENEEVVFGSKNVVVGKDAAGVGDIAAILNGELVYIKAGSDVVGAEPLGVVYHRTEDRVDVLFKDSLGSAQWGAPFRVKVQGGGLGTGGTHTIKVNASEYPFTVASGSTRQQVADAILAALPTGAGWSTEAKDTYVVIQRSYYTPAINSFEITGGVTTTILCDDVQAKLTGFLTPYGSLSRNNGIVTTYGGANLDRFITYYETSGGDSTQNVSDPVAPLKRSVFNSTDNPVLFDKYGTYEKYMEANMVRYPYSKNAILDKDGENNTQLLSSEMFTDDDGALKPKFPAAYAAASVSAGGFRWWLPAFTEQVLLIRDEYFDVINESLRAIGGALLSKTSYYWTSSERSTYHAWFYNGTYGYMTNRTKPNSRTVRAVAAFY